MVHSGEGGQTPPQERLEMGQIDQYFSQTGVLAGNGIRNKAVKLCG